MILVPTYLAESSIHGIGLYAAEDISAGTIIWEFTPHLDIAALASSFEDAPAHVRGFLEHYAYIPHDNPSHFIICMDNARFINHSDDPNTDDTTGLTIAKRDIKKGEEIVSNYAEFDAEFKTISNRYCLSEIRQVAELR